MFPENGQCDAANASLAFYSQKTLYFVLFQIYAINCQQHMSVHELNVSVIH
jgi:hypothetical protein